MFNQFKSGNNLNDLLVMRYQSNLTKYGCGQEIDQQICYYKKFEFVFGVIIFNIATMNI